MNKDKQQPSAGYRVRGRDRRIGTGQPPFMTCDGLVDHDRRSPFDRRATWLREFSIDVSNA